MNGEEAIELTQMVRVVCPAQVMDKRTPILWATLLRDESYDDALQAVLALAAQPLEPGRSRYIEPGHIIGELRRMRGRRRDLCQVETVAPPPGLDVQEYLAWQRRTLALASSGQQPPSHAAPIADPAQTRRLLSSITPKELPR